MNVCKKLRARPGLPQGSSKCTLELLCAALGTSMGSQWEVSGPQKPYLTRIQVRATEDEMTPVSGSQLAPNSCC